jgi:STE24 endopeptidase
MEFASKEAPCPFRQGAGTLPTLALRGERGIGILAPHIETLRATLLSWRGKMNQSRILFALLVVAILIFAFPLNSSLDGNQAPAPDAVAAARAQSPAPAAPPGISLLSSDEKFQPPEKLITAYTLPPDLSRKAHLLGQIGFWGQLVAFFYSLIVLLLCLKWKFGPKFRDLAERSSSNGFLQAAIFSPLLLISLALLQIPLDVARECVLRKFGISVQDWGSWLWDWTKGEFLFALIGIVLIWILYAVIRRSARRWWFYFWLVSLPIIVLLVFLQPLVVDPLFHKFEPLAQRDPSLTAALEKMVQRAGKDIPSERMFWMGAAEKTTGLNAYVTGIGASKRIVVWDTTIAKMNTPQIVFVAGHEMGHYVLHHIPKGLAFAAVSLFVLFYLGFRCIGWVLARWGNDWSIRGLDDWASFPALLLLLSIFSFLGGPIGSAFSRHVEHQADQYGLEVTHGLTPDSSQVAAQSFQILGEVDLSDPNPNPVDVFLFYDHPAIPDRVRFCLTYDPWSNGGHGEFVK